MDDDTLVILSLLAGAALLWLFVLQPMAKARAEKDRQAGVERAERQKREANEIAKREADQAKLQAEQQQQAAAAHTERKRREEEDRIKREAERERLLAEQARRASAEEEERQRREAELRAKANSKYAKLQAERDELLKSIRTRAPDFILRARLDFEREYRSRGGEGMFGQEMSPLVCFGYRVGMTNGRTETERRTILEYALAADYDVTLPFLPASYRNEWGNPLSSTRFNRIYDHLINMADLRDGRPNLEVAVSHWRSDAAWFQKNQRPRVDKYRTISR